MATKMTIRIGATVSILARYLHPSAHICVKYVNVTKDLRLEGMKVVGRATRIVNN